MITYSTEIECFGEMGEKTGWNYVFIPHHIAERLKAGNRKSFRVKGHIDTVPISGMSLIPMGEGNFILALKASLRKQLGKGLRDKITLEITEDTTFKIEMPEDLELCLQEERHLMDNFLKQPKSHQNYFIRWINEAKTEATRTKRLIMTIKAMDKCMDYGTMIRSEKQNKDL